MFFLHIALEFEQQKLNGRRSLLVGRDITLFGLTLLGSDAVMASYAGVGVKSGNNSSSRSDAML